ncbi:fumarylacetoacetate hydrolase family protein [Paenalcaligenes suwonensis]|uniref:fumarylacetoacetate hydrolase family protein n=1 Tax=Paenalcaligenes suwonensis TaxID=1202713 RepID=UPI0014095873|nr:fumarylacetoacetate hydrolase family protein [Paenalcaligenes suwonensis]NHC62485.1 fumarylacetoacetate hydrolase family protein [Paenalcaligenes suwonensis]
MNYVETGSFVGRAWSADANGPIVIKVTKAGVFDVTSKAVPTVRDLLEQDSPAQWLKDQTGTHLGSAADLLQGKIAGLKILAPCDLQAIKACGVTFAQSMIERVIEERAGGDLSAANAIRQKIAQHIQDEVKSIKPGSPEAMKLKEFFIQEGLWSQYLEVGIGPDAEVFTKSQTLSSVGHLDEIGLHPCSTWNNPEPEVVLAVDSKGRVKGATLGNDVNLRDVEGRSALLLGKAKDNNASCSIGPFIRIFDDSYSLDDVRNAQVDLLVEGEDGFVMSGKSSMKEISRDPLELVQQTIGGHHQYPDGFMLFMGTLFAPIEDRDVAGQGFTHKLGDVVVISNPELGSLKNTVRLSTQCKPWEFGISHLMRNLAGRDLI